MCSRLDIKYLLREITTDITSAIIILRVCNHNIVYFLTSSLRCTDTSETPKVPNMVLYYSNTIYNVVST